MWSHCLSVFHAPARTPEPAASQSTPCRPTSAVFQELEAPGALDCFFALAKLISQPALCDSLIFALVILLLRSLT